MFNHSKQVIEFDEKKKQHFNYLFRFFSVNFFPLQ